MTGDEELLARLGVALAPAPGEPDPAKAARLRALAEAGRGAAASSPAAGDVARIGVRRRGRLAAVAAGVAAVAASFVVGVVVGAEPPRPVRAAAHAVGLPVESPQLADARSELHDLGAALAAADSIRVEAADRRMVALVTSLSPEEKSKIEPVAHEVHLRAVSFLRERPPRR